MPQKMFTILNKLYITLCIVIMIGVAISGYIAITEEFEKSSRFDKAHSHLENIAKYDSRRPGMSLVESRELIALESEFRNETTFDEASHQGASAEAHRKHQFNPTHYLIDTSCFNYRGEAVTPNKYCHPIHSFYPGKPFQKFLN